MANQCSLGHDKDEGQPCPTCAAAGQALAMADYAAAQVTANLVLDSLVGYRPRSAVQRRQDIDYLARVLLRAQADGVPAIERLGGVTP
jgi:hypothetical protein